MKKIAIMLLLPILTGYLILAYAASSGRVQNEISFLSGKVTDGTTNEELIGASVKILKGTQLFRGSITDVFGDFRISVDPGTYTVEVSYTGYSTSRVEAVQVMGGTVNTLNFTMIQSTTLNMLEITSFKIPLIKQDQTSGGQTISSDQIKNLPTRSIYTATATPVPPTIDGSSATIKGARANATNYYIDGVLVSGNNAPAQGANRMTQEAKSSKPSMEAGKKDNDRRYRKDSIIPESGTEQYNRIVEQPFLKTKDQSFSTFSIDVDAASYSNVRRFLESGQNPPADAIRIEEMINYFDYNYPQPTGNDPIRIITELGTCPWNEEHHLLMVGLQARDIEKKQVPTGNFVFLIDVSGSMNSANKLPLVKESLYLLLDELRPNDRVALVTYAGSTGVVLESTPIAEKETIKKAIQQLGAGGGTAGASGVQLAYQTARAHFMPQGNNRVILCTDGDFNLGMSGEKELVQLIEKERESGVYLTVLGYGTGNYQDGKMQELADRGNGNHAYIDQISEAKKVLVKEFSGTLYTIAKDVKLQLDFNPDQVSEYRLIGYENRMLATEDFDNDAKDAGELGAGHTVTALYEIVPNKQGVTGNGDLLNLKFRYKSPTGNQKSQLVEARVPAVCAAQPSDNFNLAVAVAESGLLLRNSSYKGSAGWEHVFSNAQKSLKNDVEGYRQAFIDLMKKAGH